MTIVLDTSVSLAWYLKDETSEYAGLVLQRLDEDSAVAPSIWALEMANGLLVAERRGRLTGVEVKRATELVLRLPISFDDIAPGQVLGAVYDLAREQRLSVYDATYLELAMREGVPLATQDASLAAAAERVGVALV